MKFSNETLNVLKSFTAINKSILLNAGNTIKTITPEKTLIAIAEVPDTMPSQACVYDLSRFLSILSLYNDPDIDFGDKYFIISEGKRRTRYVYADISMIHTPPEKEITLPSADVTVNVSEGDLSSVLKAAGVLQFSEVAFVGEGGKCYLKAIDSANDNADDFGVEIGETADKFNVIIKTDNLKLLPLDYQVTICSKGISEFKGKGVTYYVAIDSKSTYNKGE
jgi:hypothetical protein|tara:strand:+ start:122 stop:787 length:666 start_codon:yes stop_codon:yes gene_type:complete